MGARRSSGGYMLTIERCRAAVWIHGISCLDYMAQDINEAINLATHMESKGMPYDKQRASEYADELCIVAQVRREMEGRKHCPCCKQVLP